MEAVSIVDLKAKLEEAREALGEVLWCIESKTENPEDLDEYRRFFESDPSLARVYETVVKVREKLFKVWTPALEERLKEEEEDYWHEADGYDGEQADGTWR